MNSAKILLVDDDKVSLRILDTILKSENYQTFTFSTVEEAMDYLKSGEAHPDLIISDYFMPGLSGLDFLNQVKSKTDFAAIPFLFISANKNEDIETDALQYGAIDFLKKPINKQLLLNKINALLHSLGSFSLNANKIFSGDSSMMSVHEIISYCEEEKLDGFALIIKEDEYGILTFEKGILESIKFADLSDSDALENIEQLKSYEIFIFRGKTNDSVIQKFFKHKSSPVKEIKRNITLDNIKGKLPTDKYNDLTMLVNSLQDSFEALGSTLNEQWISTTLTLKDDKQIKLEKNSSGSLTADFLSS